MGSTEVFDAQYTRDALGRITQKLEAIDGITRVWEYGYNVAGRLESVRRNSTLIAFYTYDANGNRLQADTEFGTFTGTYDNQDRLLTYGSVVHTYRPNGELAAKTVDSQTTTYEYDTLGSLTRVVLPNSDVITYLLDGRGRRVAKAVNGLRVRGWLYADEWRPIAELDGSGGILYRFVYGNGTTPEYVISNGVTYRIFSDHLGSPRMVVDANTGEVARRLDYTAFGELIQDSNPSGHSLGFGGGIYDAQTGLLHFGAREYDPSVGRFISKDPILFKGIDTSLYAYAADDPINAVDVSGFTKGGKQNKSVTHGGVELTAKSGTQAIESAVAEARALNMGAKHIKALEGLLKLTKAAEHYANKFGKSKGLLGNVVGLAIGLFEDYDRYVRARENGISYEEQLHRDLEDAGDYLDTPLGVIPNICKLKTT